jgi:phage shock protein C
MEKKLYLSDTEKKIAGVCGGVGEYFGIDPTFIRLLWIIFIFIGGSGLLAYIIAWAIIPQRPKF